MPLRPSLTRRRAWPLRFAALLILVLQVGVGLTPLIDHDGRVPASHMEQRGNRHPKAHNERTCVICGVRALQSPVVTSEPAPLPILRREIAEIADREQIASRDPPASNASRAPPRLS
jgi:hypothetical protein